MTHLQGEADFLLDHLQSAQDFLRDNPQAWCCMEVLDDLLIASAELTDFDAPAALFKATRRLADHAVAVLKVLLGDAPVRLNWADTASRPLLRPLAQAIDLARCQLDDPTTLALLQWGLALNPHDNHGWRALLAPMYLEQSRLDEALQLLDQYPDDMPPSEHLRALALFMQGKVEQAAKVVAVTHAEYPRFVQSLLPDALDRPADEDGPGILMGGDIAAWEHRMAMRPLWQSTGALAWLLGLALPTPKPKKPPKPAKAPKPGKEIATKLTKVPDGFTASQQKHLRKNYANYAQLHGVVAAIGLAPDLVMPNQWLPIVMAMRTVAPQDLPSANALKVMNQDLQAVSSLLNEFNRQVLDHQSTSQKTLADVATVLAEQGDGAAFSWAAGFVQGSELVAGAWRRAGRPVTPKSGAFGELYALAAQAQTDPKAATDGASPWRARLETDQPLLVGMSADALNPTATLVLALEDLWRVTAPLRQARAGNLKW